MQNDKDLKRVKKHYKVLLGLSKLDPVLAWLLAISTMLMFYTAVADKNDIQDLIIELNVISTAIVRVASANKAKSNAASNNDDSKD